MNTDNIYAEQLANEYAPKDTSKVVALRKLDAKAARDRPVLQVRLFLYQFFLFEPPESKIDSVE